MRGVTFNGGDEIGNEISPAFELDVDVGPRVLGADAEGYKSIVETDEYENDDDKDDQKDDEGHRERVGVDGRC